MHVNPIGSFHTRAYRRELRGTNVEHEIKDLDARRKDAVNRRRRILTFPLIFLLLLVISAFFVSLMVPRFHSGLSKANRVEYSLTATDLLSEENDEENNINACNIVIVSTFPPRACGIATFTRDMSDALEGKELSWNIGERFKGEKLCRVSIVALNHWRERHSTEYADRRVKFQINSQHSDDFIHAVAWINSKKPDLVIFQHEFGILANRGWEYVAMMRYLHFPSSVILHSPRLLLHSIEDRHLIKHLVEGATLGAMVMSSESVIDLVQGYGISSERVRYLPHGVRTLGDVDIDRLRIDAKNELGLQDSPLIFTFGLLHKDKGLDIMVEAMKSVVEQIPNAIYVIAGRPSPGQDRDIIDELSQAALKMGISKNIVFEPSFLSFTQLRSFLLATDLFVTPYYEHTPVSGVLVTALSAHRAIVSTNYKYATSIMDDSSSLVSPGNPREIGDAVLRVLTNETYKHILESKSAQIINKGRFSWYDVAVRLKHLSTDISDDFDFENDDETISVDFDSIFRPPSTGVLKIMPEIAYYCLISDFDISYNARIVKTGSIKPLFIVDRVTVKLHLSDKWPKVIRCDLCEPVSKSFDLIIDSGKKVGVYLDGKRLRKGIHLLSPIARTLYRPLRKRKKSRRMRAASDILSTITRSFPDFFGSNFDITSPRVPDGFIALKYSSQSGTHSLQIVIGDRYEIQLSVQPGNSHIVQEFTFLTSHLSPFGMIAKSRLCQIGVLGRIDGCGGVPSTRSGSEIEWKMVSEEGEKISSSWFFDPSGFKAYQTSVVCQSSCITPRHRKNISLPPKDENDVMWIDSALFQKWKPNPSLDLLFFSPVSQHDIHGVISSRHNSIGDIIRSRPKGLSHVLFRGPLRDSDHISDANRALAEALIRANVDLSIEKPDDAPANYPYLSKRVANADSNAVVLSSSSNPSFTTTIQYLHLDCTTPIPTEWIGGINSQIDKLWVASNFVKETLIQSGALGWKISVVPLPVDTHAFSPKSIEPFPLPNRCERIPTKFLFIGDKSQKYGLNTLLDVFAKGIDSACLVIVTSDELPERQSNVVHIRKHLNERERSRLYNTVNAIVLPHSLYAIESLSAELPVITPLNNLMREICGISYTGSEDIVLDDMNMNTQVYDSSSSAACWDVHYVSQIGENGEKWDEPDPMSLLSVMKRVIRDKNIAQIKSKLGRKRVKEIYDITVVAERIVLN